MPKKKIYLPLSESAIDGIVTESKSYKIIEGSVVGSVTYTPLMNTDNNNFLVTVISGITINQMIKGIRFHPYKTGFVTCVYIAEPFDPLTKKKAKYKNCLN